MRELGLRTRTRARQDGLVDLAGAMRSLAVAKLVVVEALGDPFDLLLRLWIKVGVRMAAAGALRWLMYLRASKLCAEGRILSSTFP